MKKTLFTWLALCLALIPGGCADESVGATGADGKINLTLSLASGLATLTPTGDAVVAAWGCVVLTSTLTGCVYNYNGTIQTDATLSSDAAAAGPGTGSGYTFVTNGYTFSGYEGGSRAYAFYYANTSASATAVQTSGTIDLAANPGDPGTKGADGADGADKTYLVTFDETGSYTSSSN
ncbi:MAG: hypothetical protein RRB13_07385 [bacterium]|nr:hypothetical protein [bacterium]